MDNLIFAINIVMPMTILLVLGYLLKKSGFIDEHFIAIGKKVCFYIFLSASLFKNIYDSSLSQISYHFFIFVIVAIICEALLSVFIAHRIADKKNEIGVIIQGSFRSNFAYIGIPLATMFFTDNMLIQKTSSEISMLSVFVIPLFNIISVLALSFYREDKSNTDILKRSIKGIISNPCIISIFCGILVLLLRIIIPQSAFFIQNKLPFVYKVLGYLASISTPFAFMVVGASLNFKHSEDNIKKLSLIVLLKNLVYPILILAAAYLLKIASKEEYAIMVSVFASPTAVSSAIMANEMGGDSDLANEIVIYTTIFSVLSLIIIIFLLKTVRCL